jgi:hypothetical protein
MSDEQMREQMKLDKQKMAEERKEHTRLMRKARDAQDAAREARNQPPPASGWGSMSNPESTSASDNMNAAAGQAAPNQDSRTEREARSPPSRERKDDAERASREHDERSQWGSRRSGEHPPRTLTMPHTDSDQGDTDQRRPPDFPSRGTPIYDNTG